jgi:hypothetical protein
MSFSARKTATCGSRPCPGPGHLRHKYSNLHLRRAGLTLLAGVFFILCATPAHAEILIESRVGFHGVFQLGRPFPLEIELNNTGRPVEGVLDVQVWKGGVTKGGAPYLANYRREIFLPGQARKIVQLTVDPDFLSRPLVIRFSAPDVKAAREIDLRRHFSPAPVQLLLSGGVMPPLTFGPSAQARLASLAPADLPADARALLGVSHIILYDQSLRELSRAQVLALDGWLTAGGQLLVAGSINFALYQEPALARFLPVRVNGVRQIAFAPGGGKGAAKISLAGVWAQSSTVTSGKVIADTDGTPVLVESSRGRGKILYLALDIGRPPLSNWDGLGKYLQALLAPAGGAELVPRTEWGDAVFNQLIASPKFIATYVPSAALFLAILAYLAGLGVIAWLWQKKWLAPRVALIGIATFITASSAGGYVHFSQGGNIPDGVLLVSTVLESSGDGFVEAQANLALFSTQLRPYDLELEHGWIDLTPVSSRSRDQAEPAIVTQEAGGASRYRLPLREWDYRLFRLRRVDRFPFGAEFDVQGDQLVVKVDNRSAKELVQCWLVVPGQRFELGTIPQGASWRRTFPLVSGALKEEAATARPDSLKFRELAFADKTRDILFHSSMFPRDGDPRLAGGGAAVLLGWVKDPEPRVRIDDARIQAQDYALFRAIFPLPGAEDE